jgi:hypothetical protein
MWILEAVKMAVCERSPEGQGVGHDQHCRWDKSALSVRHVHEATLHTVEV